ncbi:MBL fold metallo-hydrolase [Paenibacillus mucilaginosus]|uniref:Hydroxyacylglutathione hydrolase n=3 Tax=Paenibacillus mucilaginosus TaxID=61624 RepID=H6NDI1_9BACL|nr:MBL fold metallo-hydrolase [Paenibacillus mucilaginosus]AEI43696.1 hydroxyacylglutathione hydrolase [Paenibacillus mucilaginosus KNP414]AFC31321.1 hydroxyacylglutathione hydrolase [Paenibacillus mucilaginosus 3016]AFH63652.1 polyketide biosynthesis protein [Paenibacillus mucilaginosus K02]MCG7216932.1 MBL fold metallo-hydrolase [Paenibacillus mucilaginosus]WDM25216.1 MBL fold metallo-hydrolase [Paenibacillus mucilaginosus]
MVLSLSEENRSGPYAGYEVIPLRVTWRHYINYSYLIIDRATGQAAVVDPAWEPETILAELDRQGAVLTSILLTHAHHDHVNLVGDLCSRFTGLAVYMMGRECDFYGFSAPGLHRLEDEDTLWIGATPVRCYLTPGHSAGGACYLLPDSLFSGDTIFIEGCGMCAGAGSDPDQLYHSVKRMQRLVPDDVRVYPGHSYGARPGQTMRYLKENNIYFQIESQEHFVRFRMRKNQTNLLSFK